MGVILPAAIIVALIAALPSLAAAGLLYLTRHHVDGPIPQNCEDATFNGVDVTLKERGRFMIDAVNPAVAATRIKIPVLLIHGAEDRDTRPAHSERIFAALGGPKRLILVPGAHHNESLNNAIWPEMARWLATSPHGQQ